MSRGKSERRYPVTAAAALALAMLSLPAIPAFAQMSHNHGAGAGAGACNEPTLACATKVTPTFAGDGTLWVAWTAGGRVALARSRDLGRSFEPATMVTPEPVQLDWGPDSRPAIAIDGEGRIHVAFAIFKDKSFNGQVLYSRSTDKGVSFEVPRPITDVQESQRFETLLLDADGSLFAVWLDKRNRVPAAKKGEKYVGAALAFAWSRDHGASIGETRIAQDNTCECCRLSAGFAAPGRPVVLFRNVFDKMVRDHAVITFSDPSTPGPVRRVSTDNWRTDACPHQGPSLAIAPSGAYHVAWFTNGSARHGLFYAYSRDAGETFSVPVPIGRPDRQPSRPYLLAAQDGLWLAWKEFDGEASTVLVQQSKDDGATWSEPRVMARTRDASDHPLLVANGAAAYLSWQTAADGYKLIPLE